jgi:prepilin-type N-terminal cleavage/methylation domain-containing protein
MRAKKQHTLKSEYGFTLVEFMVATMVFSVVLLAMSYSITHISRIYQRSINTSRTQAAARSLVEALSEAVQYSASEITPGIPVTVGDTQARCIGSRQFLFAIGRKLSNDGAATSARNAVYSRPSPAGGGCANVSITSGISGGQELLGNNMRLANLEVDRVGATTLYSISARVVYGDDDLLCYAGDPTTCTSTAVLGGADLKRPDLKCKSGPGSEYCSVSELSTTVQRRLR